MLVTSRKIEALPEFDVDHAGTTDLLTSKQSVGAWQEAVAGLFKVKPLSFDAETMPASLTGYNTGSLIVISSSAPPLSLCRDNEQIVCGGIDHLLLLLNLTGESRMHAEGRSITAGPDDIVCVDLARRMQLMTTALSFIGIILPRHLVRLQPKLLDSVHGAVIRGASPLGALLGRQIITVNSILPRCAVHEAALAEQVVSNLVTVGICAVVESDGGETTKQLAPTIPVIQDYIERHLSDLNLSPETMARQFGLSRSAFYRLFEPVGGIADYIRDRRLNRAMLRTASLGRGRGAVARLALQCGFPSEAAFSRAFRRRFGLTPREAILRSCALNVPWESAEQNTLQRWMRGLIPTEHDRVPVRAAAAV